MEIFTAGAVTGGKTRLLTYPDLVYLTLNVNAAGVRDDTAKGQSWIGCNTNGTFQFSYGTTSSQDLLAVNASGDLLILGANATKATGTLWANPSDIRLKRDVAEYATGLDAITRLRPISFKYNGKGGIPDDDRLCYGLVADEVQSVMPEMVAPRDMQFDPGDAGMTPMLFLDTSNVLLALINAVKELATRIAALEAR